jgi:putative nucleotidyltransferase with HDIG domain
MKKLLEILRNSSRILYRVLIFVVAAILLLFVLPGQPVFQYEYQKGGLWKHEDLMAPFDFAILKSPEELEAERKNLISSIPPYYKLDTMVFYNEMAIFQNDFNLAFGTITNLNRQLFQKFYGYYSQIYKTGIIERSTDSSDILRDKTEIARISGNVMSRLNVGEIFSLKTAYNSITELKKQITESSPALASKINQIDFSKYIKPNLFYDPATTQKQLLEIESGISPSLGMVQAGHRIILQGEIVDADKFKILESLKISYEKKRGDSFSELSVNTGKFALILILLTMIYIFMHYYRKDLLNQFRRLIFLMLLVVSMVFISVFANSSQGIHIYLVPMAILPIFVRTFYDSRTSIFILFITTLIVGFYAPNSFEYILIEFIAGTVAVFSLARMHRRVHIVRASLWVLISNIITFSALNTIQEGSFAEINFSMYQWFVGSCILINLAYPLIYIFEKLFGFVSDVTLIEISDINQPLLRKLAEEAPGTFQHSMQIANLAEEVIRKIGGNPFLVRAGALYHDIGKIANADYFTENQFGIKNPHELLDYENSAGIIIDHVHAGLKLAKKYKLPARLLEFITTHHGTTKAKYFYLKQKQEFPSQALDEAKFQYPGPLPRTKEATVVMLADGIEAASRSLKDKTTENLRELVNSMIDQKIEEHQLDNSNVTFNDIIQIKDIFLAKLVNIYHVRIAYPKEDPKV